MNHEITVTCPMCGEEYDAHLHWTSCPKCGYAREKMSLGRKRQLPTLQRNSNNK